LLFFACNYVYAHDISSFSSLHVALRALHSFPTRRSSDLVAALAVRCAPMPDHASLIRQAVAVYRMDVPGVLPLGALVGKRQVRQDRKSTRLNSSHVKISYAVFCLKKKNTRYRRLATYIHR